MSKPLQYSLLVLSALLCAGPPSARPQNRPPDPGSAQEIQPMEGEQPDESPWQLFKIEGVIFKSDQPLPTISRQLASEIEATKTLEFGPGWETELDGRVRDVWQHRGYFKIGQLEDGDIEVENLKDPENTHQEIPVRFIIKINPGKQYQFGNISFLHNTQFDSVQLRVFFPSSKVKWWIHAKSTRVSKRRAPLTTSAASWSLRPGRTPWSMKIRAT